MYTINTFSGVVFDPFAPSESDILPADIAHALSLMCRANGHLRHFYSVARHCLNCAAEAKLRDGSENLQLAALLHDAAEAYLSDVTRPVKARFPDYRRAEDRLQDTIYERFLPAPLSSEDRFMVRQIDDAMLVREFALLGPAKLPAPEIELKSVPDVGFHGFERDEMEFLNLFETLSGRGKGT